VRLGVFFAENPQNHPALKVLRVLKSLLNNILFICRLKNIWNMYGLLASPHTRNYHNAWRAMVLGIMKEDW